MKQATRFSVQVGWKLLIIDLGLNPADVLILAGLPADLFSQQNATLSIDEYFSFWMGMEKAATDFELPLHIGQAISVESFDPPIFASLCSANLNIALQCISQFKPLIGPMNLQVDISESHTQVSISCYGHSGEIPATLGAAEVVFFTALARLGTRQPIQPLSVTVENLPGNLAQYQDYFGIELQQGAQNKIVFSAQDARQPFLTENITMWQFFEAGLKLRLSELAMNAPTEKRVKSALLEMLPSGQTASHE